LFVDTRPSSSEFCRPHTNNAPPQELESFTTAVVIRENVEEADIKAEQLKLQQLVQIYLCIFY